jgi:hypothetical protein
MGSLIGFVVYFMRTMMQYALGDGTEIMEATAHFFILLWWQKGEGNFSSFLANFCSFLNIKPSTS